MRLDSGAVRNGSERLVARYREEGLLHAQVDSVVRREGPEPGAWDLTVFLTEGMPAVLRSIEWRGAVHFSKDRVREEGSIRPGERFSVPRIERAIGVLLRMLEEEGYPFARAAVDSVGFVRTATADSVDVVIRINEGGSSRICAVTVEGNRTTKESVILRELRLQPDDLYRPAFAQTLRRRLLRLQIFASVDEPQVTLDEHDEAGLLVRVTEGAANRFDGVVGYLPADRPGASGTLTGLVHLQFRNLFGTARRLSVRWYRENERSQEVEVHYREPWVASLPVNAEVGLFQRQQDSTFVRQEVSLTADAAVSDRLGMSINLRETNVYPTQGFGRTVMGENRSLAAAAGLRYDSRDDPVTPTDGALYETTYELGTKETDALLPGSGATRTTTHRVSLDAGAYWSVVPRQVLVGTVHLRDRQITEPDLSDLERLGGASTLRGYREGQFAGTRLLWGGLEYRFLAGGRSFFYGFVDAGYVSTPAIAPPGVSASSLSRFGIGTGIRLETDLGLIGVSLAFGRGDTFSTSKLHIRIANEF
jgi:outer membrane protein assembly factor BamA